MGMRSEELYIRVTSDAKLAVMYLTCISFAYKRRHLTESAPVYCVLKVAQMTIQQYAVPLVHTGHNIGFCNENK